MKLSLSLAAAALALSVSFASAHEFKLGPLKIGHPWSRATPAGAKVGGGYLTKDNVDKYIEQFGSGMPPYDVKKMSVTYNPNASTDDFKIAIQ